MRSIVFMFYISVCAENDSQQSAGLIFKTELRYIFFDSQPLKISSNL